VRTIARYITVSAKREPRRSLFTDKVTLDFFLSENDKANPGAAFDKNKD
jgi:hypothetical protein